MTHLQRNLVSGLLVVAVLALTGCRQDMQDQPKIFPQRGSVLFPDHRGARPQVVNTVSREQLDSTSFFMTGLIEGKEADFLPFPATLEVLHRGQERYNIYCSPCHSRVGNGAGMIVQRGYKPAGNYHDDKHRAQPLGHYFAVMTNGYGAMPDYAAQLTPQDRWAVAAYIRALQLSQSATEKDVPAGTRIDSLANVAESAGYPAAAASPWVLPKTAVQATPHDPAQGARGNSPGTVESSSSLTPPTQKQQSQRQQSSTPAMTAESTK